MDLLLHFSFCRFLFADQLLQKLKCSPKFTLWVLTLEFLGQSTFYFLIDNILFQTLVIRVVGVSHFLIMFYLVKTNYFNSIENPTFLQIRFLWTFIFCIFLNLFLLFLLINVCKSFWANWIQEIAISYLNLNLTLKIN